MNCFPTLLEETGEAHREREREPEAVNKRERGRTGEGERKKKKRGEKRKEIAVVSLYFHPGSISNEKMLRLAGVLVVVTLGLSAAHSKGTVGEGQLAFAQCGALLLHSRWMWLERCCVWMQRNVRLLTDSSLYCTFFPLTRK